jgi:hypothetical protein
MMKNVKFLTNNPEKNYWEFLLINSKIRQEKHDYHYFRHNADAFWTVCEHCLLDTKHF